MDFKNTIIILTSNIGSQYLLDGITADGLVSPEAQASVMGDLRRMFRPELLNRLDEILMFHPLSKTDLSHITDNLMRSLSARLAEKDLSLHLTEEARSYIIDHGYDPVYGARPLRRFIQSHVETLIAKFIISSPDLAPGTVISVYPENGELTCSASL